MVVWLGDWMGANGPYIFRAFDLETGRIILTSAEDNLGKGAGSQAVQSFNIIFGLAEWN